MPTGPFADRVEEQQAYLKHQGVRLRDIFSFTSDEEPWKIRLTRLFPPQAFPLSIKLEDDRWLSMWNVQGMWPVIDLTVDLEGMTVITRTGINEQGALTAFGHGDSIDSDSEHVYNRLMQYFDGMVEIATGEAHESLSALRSYFLVAYWRPAP